MELPIGTFTNFNAFENCPHKFFKTYVLKAIPYVESPEMKWGNDVHSAMENRIGKGTPLPENMQQAEPVAAMCASMPPSFTVRVEYRLAMTAQGQPCGWAGQGCWFRGKLDYIAMPPALDGAWMLDWKTGNVREDPLELETGALLLRVNHQSIAHIEGEYFWMKAGQKGFRYTLNDPSSTFAWLQSRRAEMEKYHAAGDWPKRKNPLCGWCGVVSCEFNTAYKRK